MKQLIGFMILVVGCSSIEPADSIDHTSPDESLSVSSGNSANQDLCSDVECRTGFTCLDGKCVFAAASPCNASYFDETWRVGVDIPITFVPGEPRDLSNAIATFRLQDQPTLTSEHVVIELNSPREYSLALPTFDAVFDRWIELGRDSYELLGITDFVSSNGGGGSLVYWRAPSTLAGEPQYDIYVLEGWVPGTTAAHSLRASAFAEDFQILQFTFESAARSLCAE